MIETPEANLTKGMRQLNWVFTQWSNRRHKRTGHLLQGCYKAILVARDSYFLELSRYIVLNPVRAAMVKHPREWVWSSYSSLIGKSAAQAWLTTEELLAQFGKRRAGARRKYQEFVKEGIGDESIWKDLKGQIYFGDEDIVEEMRGKLGERDEDVNIPKAQQRRTGTQAKHNSTSVHESRRRNTGRLYQRRVQLSTNCEGIWHSFHHGRRIVRENRTSPAVAVRS